jgi:hypothetical protein
VYGVTGVDDEAIRRLAAFVVRGLGSPGST